MNDLNLIKYAILLDDEVRNMFYVDKAIRPEDRYFIRAKYAFEEQHNADKICEDLNKLISDYLDKKLPQIDNLKCCGNCIHRGMSYGEEYCKIEEIEFCCDKCDNWEYDNIKRENKNGILT